MTPIPWKQLSTFAMGYSRPGLTITVYSPDAGQRWWCDIDRKDGPDERTEHETAEDAKAHAQAVLAKEAAPPDSQAGQGLERLETIARSGNVHQAGAGVQA